MVPSTGKNPLCWRSMGISKLLATGWKEERKIPAKDKKIRKQPVPRFNVNMTNNNPTTPIIKKPGSGISSAENTFFSSNILK
ncbi:hypothetical protein VIBNIAM115_1210081 [Vibrio nigripulchritudo AM115]|nr:hypothetical protein VIBNIAM115_1210081 [Vibrio nigripulchritudo AM115]